MLDLKVGDLISLETKLTGLKKYSWVAVASLASCSAGVKVGNFSDNTGTGFF
jgi:hypothetical protein